MSGKIVEAHERVRGDEEGDCGCAFIVDGADPGPGRVNFCNAPRGSGSAYCLRHHALCHLTEGSAAEELQLSEIEALAEAVGGRMGREARHPPDHLLERLARIARASLRPSRS
jgi:hypothetical protein